jgi:hypothetical protein
MARAVLVESAHAAAHTRDTYLAAQYRRPGGRRNDQQVTVAVGHSILVNAYHVLDQAQRYANSAATTRSSGNPQAPTPSAWSVSSTARPQGHYGCPLEETPAAYCAAGHYGVLGVEVTPLTAVDV